MLAKVCARPCKSAATGDGGCERLGAVPDDGRLTLAASFPAAMTDTGNTGFLAELRRLYPGLDQELLHTLSTEFEQVEVAGGHVLMHEGDTSDALYILMNGRLGATRRSADGGERIGEIARGEMIGEMSLLGGGRRTATVTALRDSRLLRVSNQAFLTLMQRHPSVTRQFIQLLMRRLSGAERKDEHALSTLAIVPLGVNPASGDFIRGLAAALGGRVAACCVDRQRVEATFPGCFESDRASGLAAWLDDQEQRHRMVIYLASPADDAWTRLCLRQADRVLLVADMAEDAEPGAVEALLRERDAAGDLRGSELVLLEPAGRPAGQVGRWLASRRLRRHHLVRPGDPDDLARLCRHLLGGSVGLALGGGGARAFAEIGVLRALAEARIPVDVIGGTSMGAVVGALAASGHDAAAILDRLRGALRHKPFSGLTLPLVSLLSGRRLAAMTQDLFGDMLIEEMRCRYLCVSSNLTRGTLHVAERGSLARWVLASNAVPGIVPPVVQNGELFVDGGLINNVPADVVAQRNAGPVIAVNVSGTATLSAGVDDDADLSGWQLLLSGHRRAVPSLSRVLVRAMLMASARHAESMRGVAALYLAPELPGMDVSDWNAIDRLVEAGYANASEALAAWDARPGP